jgi:predicted PurR-regulated permease PerM
MGQPSSSRAKGMEDGGHAGPSPVTSAMRVQFDVATAAILKVGGALLAAWLVVKVWPVLVQVFVSLLLVATFNPIVQRLETRFNRAKAITVLTVGVLLLVAAVAILMFPPLVRQAHSLRTDLPRYAGIIEAAARRAGVPLQFKGAAADWTQRIAALGPQLASLFTNVLSGAAGAVTVAVLTVFLLLDGPRIEVELMRLLPHAERRPVRRMLDELATEVGAYTRAQLVTSALAGLFAFLLLWSLRVPEPLALAFVMAVANAIPMIGPLLGTVPAVLMALTRSGPTALAVGVGYLLYFQFENTFLIPRMYSKSMKLSASAVVIAITMGATLMGILGAILALPVAAAVPVVLRFVSGRRTREAEATAGATAPRQ